MIPAVPRLLQGALQSPFPLAPEWIWAGVVAAAAAASVVFALALSRIARRGSFAASREIVRAAEEMAEGRYDHPPVLSPGDPLQPAAAALVRLAATVRGRTTELERRVRMLDDIVSSARDAVFLLTDTDGDIRFASAGAERLFGWPGGGGIGRNLASLFDAPDFEAFLPKLSRRSLKDGSLQHYSPLIGQGSLRVNASLRVAAFHNLPSGGEGWLIEIRDASGEDSLRAALRESEEQHRALVESLPLGVFVVQNGTVVFANASLKEMLGVHEGFEGRDFRDFLAAEDLLRVLDRMRSAEAGSEPSFTIECGLMPSGAAWSVEVSMSASRIVYGGRPAVIGSVRDVGPDRDTLRRVLISEAKLDAALEASEEALLLIGAAPSGGTVTLANRRFEDMFGLSQRELAGLSLEDLAERLAPLFSAPGEIRDYLRRLQADLEESVTMVFESARLGGRSFEFSSRPAVDRKGRTMGRVLAVRDVSLHRDQQRRLAREAEELARVRDLLERKNRELAELNQERQARSEEIESANQELRTLDGMKSNLLANVSHELQTPLVSIKGYTEMILKGRLGAITEEQKKGLEVSLRNIDRLIGMINNLLNFSRIERDMSEIVVSAWSLHPLVEEAIDVVRKEAEEKRVALTTRYMTGDLTVKADRDKIAQVFLNLLSNAVKYNRDGGAVEIDVRKGKKGYLIVDVRDTGVGMPRESLERIFERFYREEEGAKGGTAGTGIGLAIVRDILRMHGCIIKADSKLGEGSVFTFTLPLSASAEEAAEGAPRATNGAAEGDAEHPRALRARRFLTP